jgi:hypothetical protein
MQLYYIHIMQAHRSEDSAGEIVTLISLLKVRRLTKAL